MKTLLILLLLTPPLLAQDRTCGPDAPGPGAIGDTFDLTSLDIRLFDWDYCFVGSSLYTEVRSQPHASFFRKIAELPIPVLAFESVRFSEDSILGLWTGEAEYSFNVKRSTLTKVDAYGLLSPFLAYPVVAADVGTRWSTCGGGGSIETTHEALPDPLPSLRDEVRIDDDDGLSGVMINGVNLAELTWRLRSVNLDPHRLPSLREFTFDAEALLAYYERVADDLRYGNLRNDTVLLTTLYFPFTVGRRSDFFLGLPKKIQDIGPEITGPSLLNFEGMWASTSGYFETVALVNRIGDTLFCTYRSSRRPSRLIPFWTLRYGETEFRCFDPALSRMLTELLPEGRPDRELEEKVDFLYAVAWQMGLGRWE